VNTYNYAVVKHQPSTAYNSAKMIDCQPHAKCITKHLKP